MHHWHRPEKRLNQKTKWKERLLTRLNPSSEVLQIRIRCIIYTGGQRTYFRIECLRLGMFYGHGCLWQAPFHFTKKIHRHISLIVSQRKTSAQRQGIIRSTLGISWVIRPWFNFVRSLCDREVASSASNHVCGGQCHLIHLTILERFSLPTLAYMCTKVA